MEQWTHTALIMVLISAQNVNLAFDLPVGREKLPENKPVTFIPASTPVNLTASASVYNVTPKLLLLNISWDINKEGHQASGYNVHVWSLNDSQPHCDSEPYYAFIENPNSTNWIISPKPMGEGIHDVNTFSVVPECSYRIRLEANPHNGKTYAEINYKVPECVGGVCSCRNADKLPRPELHAEHMSWQTVNLTWSVPDLQNVSSFILRAGPRLVGGSQSSVYDLRWSRVTEARGPHHLSYTADQGGRHAATLHVVDQRHCLGPEQQVTFMIENAPRRSQQEMFTDKKIAWMALLGVGSFLIVFCLFAIFFGHKCFLWFENKKQKNRTFSQGFFYKSVSMKSQRVFRRNSSLREWNVLYVEKEIEEAKARGEVDSYEISYNRLTFQREIGRGAFGQVFLANAAAIRGVPGSRVVAVKKLKGSAGTEEKEEFLEEISMLKRVGQHPNIVPLLACCTLRSDLCMVMEFIPCGDLLRYLRGLRHKLDARKPSITSMSDGKYSAASTVMTSLNSNLYDTYCQPENSQLDYVLDHRELHKFALQIARGMAHLEAKSITHRDLAARNILIGNNKVLKISDFGLSRRGVYVNTRRRKVPLRWLSIEAMRDSLYSSKSDVWAFAIVLWEIGTLGGFPYPTVADFDLLQFLKNGNRLEKPEIVSNNLYSVMMVCWSEMADDRPSFAELVAYLEPNPDNHVYVDFSCNPRLPPTSAYIPSNNAPGPCQ